MRRSAAYALGTAFSRVPDKNLAWQDLHRLTQDEDSDVRTYAYHSLGRASVFKATKTDDKGALKAELEAAITFLENRLMKAPIAQLGFAILFIAHILL